MWLNMLNVDLKLEFYGGRGWLCNAFMVWAQGPITRTQKTKKITNFGGIRTVLVVPLLGFIFLKMGGSAQEFEIDTKRLEDEETTAWKKPTKEETKTTLKNNMKVLQRGTRGACSKKGKAKRRM